MKLQVQLAEEVSQKKSLVDFNEKMKKEYAKMSDECEVSNIDGFEFSTVSFKICLTIGFSIPVDFFFSQSAKKLLATERKERKLSEEKMMELVQGIKAKWKRHEAEKVASLEAQLADRDSEIEVKIGDTKNNSILVHL